jgi:hypothetical protein
MDKSELQDIIKEAITKSADETGWANLAKIGAYLRKKGIKYGRLSKMLSDHQEIIETKMDDTINPPVAYAKIKDQ